MHGQTIMKPLRKSTAALALLLTVLIAAGGWAIPATVSAQQVNGTTYTTKMTGEKISWSAPWSFDTNNSSVDTSSETVSLTSDVAVVLIGYLPAGIDMNQARDQLLAAFQNEAQSFKSLDKGSYAGVSYSLDVAELNDTNLGVFTLFLGSQGNGATVVDLFLAPVSTFTQGMNSAKEKIAIGGTPIFQGVTPGGLQNLLDRNVGTSGSSNANASSSLASTDTSSKPTSSAAAKTTSEPAETPTEAASGGLDSGGLHLGGGSDNTASPTKAAATKSASMSSGTSQGAVDPQLEALGVTAPGKYTSPQFGAKLTWDKNWVVSQDKQGNPMVTSDTSQGTDTVLLDCKIADGFIFFTIADASKGRPAQYKQYWNSDTYFEKAGLVNAEVLTSSSTDTDATVVIRHDASTTNSAKLIEVMQAHVTADGNAIVVTRAVTSLSTNIPDFFTAMASGLTIDGNPLMSTADVVHYVTVAAAK